MWVQIQSAFPTAGRKEARPALSLPAGLQFALAPSLVVRPVLSIDEDVHSACGFSSHGMQVYVQTVAAGLLRLLVASQTTMTCGHHTNCPNG